MHIKLSTTKTMITFTTPSLVVTVFKPTAGSLHVMIADPSGNPTSIEFDMLSMYVDEANKVFSRKD